VAGARRVFRTGIVLVLLGGIFGGLAPDLATLAGIPPGRRRERVHGIAGRLDLIGIAGFTLAVSGRRVSSPIGWLVAITVVFGLAQGAAGAANQTALYAAALSDRLGTASGLLPTFGYLGSIAASAVTGVVFRTRVIDAGLHQIGAIMVGVSLARLGLTVAGTVRRPAPR
jgi:hypothetical protein